jgi:hypothetical protein
MLTALGLSEFERELIRARTAQRRRGLPARSATR